MSCHTPPVANAGPTAARPLEGYQSVRSTSRSQCGAPGAAVVRQVPVIRSGSAARRACWRTAGLHIGGGYPGGVVAADLDHPGAVAAVRADVRACLGATIRMAQDDFLRAAGPDGLAEEADETASVLAFTALQTLEQALPEYHSSALDRLSRTSEADAEAHRAYRTEENRHRDRAAATAAASTARERTAEHLLPTRLERLRGQTTAHARRATASWADRLTELAARPSPATTDRSAAAG